MRIVSLAIIFLSFIFSIEAFAALSSGEFNEKNSVLMVTADKPEFTIKIQSNPTTGYSWFLQEYDSQLITPINHKFVEPNKKLIGAPGFEVWTFLAKPAAFIVPQQTMIHFIYVRPWEAKEPSKQLIFKVIAP